MCAHFTMKAKANEIASKLGIKISEDIEYNVSVRGFMKVEKAPIILFEDGKLVIKEAAFSLCPSWSKEYPFKSSTYNARLERENPKQPGVTQLIYEVPTWRESFSSGKTCLVPMQDAIESCYFGTHAGQMVRFSTKNRDLFFAIGLYSEWLDKKTGEVIDTFTLLTDDPYEFVFKSGHDRSFLLIEPTKNEEWLTNRFLKPQERLKFIRSNRVPLPTWRVETERHLKADWSKRAPTKDEIEAIRVWNG